MAATDLIAAGFEAFRAGAGLLDRSERGKLALTGADAKEFLQGQVTNDVAALTPGRGCYAAFLTPKGGRMAGDLRILDLGDELLLDCERASLQPLFNMILRYKLAADVELHKRTLESGLISLIGPRAREVAGADPGPAEHDCARVSVHGIDAVAAATDTGIDLFCEAGAAEGLAAALLGAGAVRCDEAAAEALRIEHGRPRFGLDIGDAVMPAEAGIVERAVSFTKGCYVGQETVARLHYRGKPNRHLRGLALSAPAAHGDAVVHAGREVGAVGSAATHPDLGRIALAVLRREAEPGAEVEVGSQAHPATVVELPFRPRG